MLESTAHAYAAALQRFRATGSVWLAADEIPAGAEVPAAWGALLTASDDRVADALAQMWTDVIDRLPAVAQFFRDKLARPAVFCSDDGDVMLLYPYTVEHGSRVDGISERQRRLSVPRSARQCRRWQRDRTALAARESDQTRSRGFPGRRERMVRNLRRGSRQVVTRHPRVADMPRVRLRTSSRLVSAYCMT